MYKVKFKEGKLHLYSEEIEIGLISPEATWVKEGDEFEEDEIRIVKIPWGRFHTKEKIQIKGPCGHFH